MRRRELAGLLPALVALAACGGATHRQTSPGPRPAFETVKIEGVPHVRQRPDFCGEACVAMYMEKLGLDVDQDAVFDASGLDPTHGRGCYTPELRLALMELGFSPGEVWARFEPEGADAELEKQWAELHADLIAGVPSIVCMHYDDQPETTEHFRLILGYDAETDAVVYHEPAQDEGSYRTMPRSQFLALWPLTAGDGDQTAIRLRLAGQPAKPAAGEDGIRPAAYAQRVLALRESLGPEFDVMTERPFVVVGERGPEKLEKYSADVIRWAVDRLRAQFFSQAPEQIVEIYLFETDESYRAGAMKFFGDDPDTPYGYYSPTHQALVMNISTGGGTLVHEIVHPFMAANFPRCPSWFDEGLASLFEQSAGRGEKIVGLTNWRLPGLQSAIREGDVPSFKSLSETGERPFYDEDPGTNYSQARYLCYWLQEHGKLEAFYRAFTANQADDPTGYETLRKTVRVDDMVAFQREWETWVLALKR